MKNASDIHMMSRGEKGSPEDQIYQVSTMTSLLDGVYDGDFDMASARRRNGYAC